MSRFISLRGVRQNNLQGINLDLPLHSLIAVTGLSGAGKSSLVFETLHAEGQRRYVETFSAYTRQFLEMCDRPKVDSVENIPPSIALSQTNTVKTSRSTVGTMTELCDYFKVWFCQEADAFDPATGELLRCDTPETAWESSFSGFKGRDVLLTFPIARPASLPVAEVCDSLLQQGYTRAVTETGLVLIEQLAASGWNGTKLAVVQDRFNLKPTSQIRFLEAFRTAQTYGHGLSDLRDTDGKVLASFSGELRSPKTGKTYAAAQPAIFSFNSPQGACPRCKGFGRIIEVDYHLVIPNESLSLADGAIKAFTGSVYQESLRDLLACAKRLGIPTHKPYRELTESQKLMVIDGEPDYREGDYGRKWYGVKGFFGWLESSTYKMHVRVFLSRYRAYVTCPECAGTRLRPDALLWKWQGRTLPELYQLPVRDLSKLIQAHPDRRSDEQSALARPAILSRLRYLEEVGLGYLTLDRSSRTLSGGEVERVNLTACLGTSLVDTLFILDEPTVGLHARDISKLTGVLRRLVDQGNTVVVVEHDEAVMRASDQIIEIGPKPGSGGGKVVFQGTPSEIEKDKYSITGAYLSGREKFESPLVNELSRGSARVSRAVSGVSPETSTALDLPSTSDPKQGRGGTPRPTRETRVLPEPVHATTWLEITGATKHNLRNLDVRLPLGRLVCLTGVSGSGKSTLLDSVIAQHLLLARGEPAEDLAQISSLTCPVEFADIVLVDQSPVSRTPRSNPAVFTGAWEHIRNLLAETDEALSAGLISSHFSFNSGEGRCPRCEGLGCEEVEMQFLADVRVPCPLCAGRRFQPHVLAIHWNGKGVDEILGLTVAEAVEFFKDHKKVLKPLQGLAEVGLGYLPLGQPLNSLSGGESQRLKLVKYLGALGTNEGPSLLLLDEPTTGLHRDDVRRLLGVMRRLVAAGHSLFVIEHQLDVIAGADWVIELGPDAGDLGGQIVFAGTPPELARTTTPTGPFLAEHFGGNSKVSAGKAGRRQNFEVAEEAAPYLPTVATDALRIFGANHHNLKDVNLTIPHHQITVLTGVSGSGKSTLAFDIVFAEGQRRFLESMSPYARQFVESLPRPDVASLTGIPPTVAIEQRVTRGTRKSTVATITEVAQYLRLLYAKVGVQHSLSTGEPLNTRTADQAYAAFTKKLAALPKSASGRIYLCARVVNSRKGHHEPLAKRLRSLGIELLRADGNWLETKGFKGLERYAEHTIEAVLADLTAGPQGVSIESSLPIPTDTPDRLRALFDEALKIGQGSALLISPSGKFQAWFSLSNVDPVTGESYPELDPKNFSWNSSQGWCLECRGTGRLAQEETEEKDEDSTEAEEMCPACFGDRLNPVSRMVRLPRKSGESVSLPKLLKAVPAQLLENLGHLDLDARGQAVAREIIPEITERLRFLGEVGLDYLGLDRETATLSGGEAQRIRLAAQLGSTLSGVLYVLDEPSIGLHARDNDRLLDSLKRLKQRGNTLLIVEHDEDTMRLADHLIDVGPGAGIHGGTIVAQGSVKNLSDSPNSLTGQYLLKGMAHPLRGQTRDLPTAKDGWISLEGASFRNLKGFDLKLARARLNVLCGVSGAGKSTFVHDLLKPAAQVAIETASPRLGPRELLKHPRAAHLSSGHAPLKALKNAHIFRTVVEIDQSPIGKTPRSTPATYTGIFDLIRDCFGMLPEAKRRGLDASSFSFNTKGGRCEACGGAGEIKHEMGFMPDARTVCEACHGKRYGAELADVRWRGKNIADVLAMSFEEAATFFDFHDRLKSLCGLMVETGLGYLTLGQPSPTLSGGEAQRLQLVTELAKGLPSWKDKSRARTFENLYLLEEPTIGLHPADCERLLKLLHRLVDQGHTVVVIEHNFDVIAEADWLIELGPEGGEKGGQLLHQGNVTDLLKVKESPTAPFLKRFLKHARNT